MKRRDLIKGAALLPLIGETVFGRLNRRSPVDQKIIIRPKRLSAGDTVAVIAPSSAASADAFDKAIANIGSLGLKAKVGKFARGVNGFLSGTDKERLGDLHWAFNDTTINAVWCVRGGSGSPRLLPDVDYQLIKKNAKIFIGYSDTTALHLAIHQMTGLVTFHGPVASSEMSEYSRAQIVNTIMTSTAPYKILPSEFNRTQTSQLFKTAVISPGKCRGQLIGGNLSLLAALAGTPYALGDLKGKILFVEDINEPPYKVDRMFTQLRQSCDLRSLAGVALGIFSNGDPSVDAPTTSLMNVLKDRLGDLGIPVIYGLSFGHIRDNCTLPVGIRAEMDTATETVTLIEAAVK